MDIGARITIGGILVLLAGEASGTQFHIEAGDMPLALNLFSEQASLQVLYDYNVAHGRIARTIDGDLESVAALRTLLVGTGLMFDFVNDWTVAVVPAQSQELRKGLVSKRISPATHIAVQQDLPVSKESSCVCGEDLTHDAVWANWCMVDADAARTRWAPECNSYR
jgi:hypothetical protein